VAKAGRVITADTQTVVVDSELVAKLERREPIRFRDLMEGSVQIWTNKVRDLRLESLPTRREIYQWPHEYDPDFLGYMAGILSLRDFEKKGYAIF
jgi:hypothetical protein